MRRSFAIFIVALAAACAAPLQPMEIDRQRAMELARAQVTFEPFFTDAVTATAAGRLVWRVTFRGRLPGQPPDLFETVVVEIDRRTGGVVSVARS